MMNLIPSVKSLQMIGGYIEKSGLNYKNMSVDNRLIVAMQKLPFSESGLTVEIDINETMEDAYELIISEMGVYITAQNPEGGFNAIQTLRQIWEHDSIPCMHIKDKPDFKYRGFYHDVTRGKVPTVDTIKRLIDDMAYYKMNSLQLYVEHTYEFEECKEINEQKGFYTKEELKELDEYCEQNFIEFIPSLSTFGHMYEILHQEQYKELRVLKDHVEEPNFWFERMAHHTIDPLNDKSIELVGHLIDQYSPLFKSNIFNICGDETFDLKKYANDGHDVGRLYVDFIKKIIERVKHNEKKVMMWADILLQHPEVIEELPEDIILLNWDYAPQPSEENVKKITELQRNQIVCPGTWSWRGLCEVVEDEEKNISRMIEYGYKYGAGGVLNTNWGDWGNPCSIELAMYGLILSAEKSWSATTKIDESFYDVVNFLLYGSNDGMTSLKKVSGLYKYIDWIRFCRIYFQHFYGQHDNVAYVTKETVEAIQKEYQELVNKLSKQVWKHDMYRQELLLSAEGFCVMAELGAKVAGIVVERVTDTTEWLNRYRNSWLSKNKASELYRIEEMFNTFEVYNG